MEGGAPQIRSGVLRLFSRAVALCISALALAASPAPSLASDQNAKPAQARVEAPRVDSSKQESSRLEAPREGAGRMEPAKGETAKAESRRAPPSKAGAAKADADPRPTSELALEYQRISEQAEKATLCIFDPKCISSDRKVLDLFVQRRELLDRIAARAERGDLEAGYWRGSVAMEQGKRQMQRGEIQSDDLGSRKEAMYIAAVGAEEFRLAARFLKPPADKGMPEACERLAEILAQGMGLAPDVKRAAEYYRCAGLGYLKEGRKDEAALVVGKMRGFLPGNHMYVVELYARLITREPSAPWRVPSQLAAEYGQIK